jgi:hypothetical protein
MVDIMRLRGLSGIFQVEPAVLADGIGGYGQGAEGFEIKSCSFLVMNTLGATNRGSVKSSHSSLSMV